MGAGRLFHVVTIKKVTKTADGYGGFTEVLENVMDTRAEIKPVAAREGFFAMKREYPVTHEVTMRFNPLILPGMKLVHRTRVFDIHGVVHHYERGRWMELLCEEKDAGCP